MARAAPKNKRVSSKQRSARAQALYDETAASPKKIPFPKVMDDEARRKRLGLVDRQHLARAVLNGDPLEDHERKFIFSLLLFGDPPRLRNFDAKWKNRSTKTALRDDEIAEKYFIERALFPDAKHKEEIAPSVAKMFRVSRSYVDKVLLALDPARRLELESNAEATMKAMYAVFASSRRTP